MPFELLKAGPTDGALFFYPVTSTLTAAVGDCLAADRTNNDVQLATAASTVLTIECIGQEAVTASSAGINAIPIIGNASQMWLAETANNTNNNQLLERCVLTDENTVNNTGTDVAGTTGVWQNMQIFGAVTDNRMIGHFITAKQVTA